MRADSGCHLRGLLFAASHVRLQKTHKIPFHVLVRRNGGLVVTGSYVKKQAGSCSPISFLARTMTRDQA